MKEKVNCHSQKIITFKSYKNCDLDDYANHLSTVPWHVGELFDDI